MPAGARLRVRLVACPASRGAASRLAVRGACGLALLLYDGEEGVDLFGLGCGGDVEGSSVDWRELGPDVLGERCSERTVPGRSNDSSVQRIEETAVELRYRVHDRAPVSNMDPSEQVPDLVSHGHDPRVALGTARHHRVLPERDGEPEAPLPFPRLGANERQDRAPRGWLDRAGDTKCCLQVREWSTARRSPIGAEAVIT